MTPGAQTTATVAVVAGMATEVSIVPPGSQPAPTATPISVGPLPATTQPSESSVTGQTTGTETGTSATSLPTATASTSGTATNQPAGLTYTVKAGDTLSAIAKRYGVTTSAIQEANNITNASKIVVGQRLIIPGVFTEPSSSGTTMTTTTNAQGQTIYVVQRGDNLSRIAAHFGTTVSAIVQANNISNPSLIYAGQKLIIP
jgi:LysM repeat protein